jgi:hypothetical protein
VLLGPGAILAALLDPTLLEQEYGRKRAVRRLTMDGGGLDVISETMNASPLHTSLQSNSRAITAQKKTISTG